VEVPPVDERHLDGGAAEVADGLDAAEPAADDDDAFARCLRLSMDHVGALTLLRGGLLHRPA
jgi:hypothetical protein